MLRVGETVGPYEILARLKAGGMATLFVGQKRGAAGFSRHVAIKVVHEHLATDEEFVRMFVDEALLQARIHHPNVVHVEELGETPGPGSAVPVHYLVMEYVYGCSLSQMLDSLARRNRRLSPELAVHIAIQTLAGLHAAHELKDERGVNLGVVHRDVSPQNVLLAYEGHVKLIDFGVAKARNRSQQTTSASLKGKLRYMPPEQAMGAMNIDRRADVYALGIVLWEMLAFRKLFSAKDDLILLDMVRNPKIVPPSEISKELPKELDRVVMKALAPRVEDRYATAQDFRRALAEAMPKAMLVDASHVADLLVAVMSEQMKKDREALPSQLSAVVAHEARRESVQADEALMTMTISAAGKAFLSDLSIEVEAPIHTPTPLSKPAFAPPPVAPPSVEVASTPNAPLPEAVIAKRRALADTWRGDPAMGTPTRPAEAGPSKMLPIVAGIVTLTLVVIAAGAWYALRVRDEPIATSLSPEIATELATSVPIAPPTTIAPAVAVPTTPTDVVQAPAVEVPTTPVAEPVAEVPPPEATTTPSATSPPPTTTTRAARPPRRRTTGGGSVPLADEW